MSQTWPHRRTAPSIAQRNSAIDHETQWVATEVDAGRTRLRAETSSGVPVASREEADLDRLAARGVELLRLATQDGELEPGRQRTGDARPVYFSGDGVHAPLSSPIAPA